MLGIVPDDIFEEELAKCNHVEITRGRGPKVETPELIREIIAEEVIAGDSTQKEIAQQFGVSTSSVSAYANGATSTATYHEPDKRLQKHNDEVRNAIIGTARSKLIEALSKITPEKLENSKVRDIASVAKDMSAVIHNTEPSVSNTNLNAQFVFHVPKQKHESDYDVIEVTQ